jgi:hypothetical protein
VPLHQLACRGCWRALPEDLRADVSVAYRQRHRPDGGTRPPGRAHPGARLVPGADMTRYTRTKARACDGKKRFPDKRSAHIAIAIRIRQGTARGALAVYRCPGPDRHWHVGHRSPKKRGHR